ncbi:VWA domain-containing protein [Streptomyces sp. SID3343]|uniref:VWA domain-containing protein n=1 Tax=Streptomyces sp. SID3343 TaxID=2690260 RepID=UPI00136DF21B|nr:VWA domain-containing protein [Streptomyces sp. SID3343]MYW02510.1 VWA domain-containing protein [Streptomyces sp. SID3343]
MGLRSLLRNVFRSRSSGEAAETPETADVRVEPAEPAAVETEPVSIPESRGETTTPADTGSAEPVSTAIPVQGRPAEPKFVQATAEDAGSVDAAAVPVAPVLPDGVAEPVGETVDAPVREPAVEASVEAPVADREFTPVAEVEPEAAVAPPVAEPVAVGSAAVESAVVEPAVVETLVVEPLVVTDPEPEPEPKPEASPAATSAPVAEPVAKSLAAVPPARVEDAGLAVRSTEAAAAVGKCGLAGRRVDVYLVLDRSGSMRSYYKDGTVQHLADQTLALSAQLGEATVRLVFFSTDIDGVADLDPTNHAGRIEELHGSYGHMGRTNYHWAIAKVVDHYRTSGSTDPALVIFQTDGAPTSRPAAAKALCDAAELPIFWQFVGFGDPEAKGFDFLRKLDELTVPAQRVVDNAGFFHAGHDPRVLSDGELYDQLLLEFPEWLDEARTAGVITTAVAAPTDGPTEAPAETPAEALV